MIDNVRSDRFGRSGLFFSKIISMILEGNEVKMWKVSFTDSITNKLTESERGF